jgi:hypothetical protein
MPSRAAPPPHAISYRYEILSPTFAASAIIDITIKYSLYFIIDAAGTSSYSGNTSYTRHHRRR